MPSRVCAAAVYKAFKVAAGWGVAAAKGPHASMDARARNKSENFLKRVKCISASVAIIGQSIRRFKWLRGSQEKCRRVPQRRHFPYSQLWVNVTSFHSLDSGDRTTIHSERTPELALARSFQVVLTVFEPASLKFKVSLSVLPPSLYLQ